MTHSEIEFSTSNGRTGGTRMRTFLRGSLGLLALVLATGLSGVAHAVDYTIIKQKACRLLVSPATGLAVGQTHDVRTQDGKSFSFRVKKSDNRRAQLEIIARGPKCQSVRGMFSIGGSLQVAQKKFLVGVMGNAGLFTFKQPFSPTTEYNPDGSVAEQQPQTINGLSGISFSAGGLMRFAVNSAFALDLGVSYLNASTSGKTTLGNNDQYTVSAGFEEAVIQPAVSITKCIAARLYCRAGGLFSVPLSARIAIKESNLSLDSNIKYSRLGGDVGAGLNLGSAFALVGGAQLSIIKGSFQFPDSPQVTLKSPLTVFIYGGFVSAF